LEDEADTDPDGEEQHSVSLTEMTEGQHTEGDRQCAADEQQDAAAVDADLLPEH
jgi:hypothetical protein